MKISTRFAIAGALISAAVAFFVGVISVTQSTADIRQNARVDLLSRSDAIAPVLAAAPPNVALQSTLSASQHKGVRVEREQGWSKASGVCR